MVSEPKKCDCSPFNFDHAMARMAKRREELLRAGGRRYHACHAASDMREVIEALPDSPQKAELLNLSTATLRMVLIENDGGPLSPSKLNAF